MPGGASSKKQITIFNITTICFNSHLMCVYIQYMTNFTLSKLLLSGFSALLAAGIYDILFKVHVKQKGKMCSNRAYRS